MAPDTLHTTVRHLPRFTRRAVALALVGLGATAAAAPAATITLNNGPGGNGGAYLNANTFGPPFNQTTDIDNGVFVVSGTGTGPYTFDCNLDQLGFVPCGSAPAGPSFTNVNVTDPRTPFSVAGHEMVVRVNDAVPSSATSNKYEWRLEPMQYTTRVLWPTNQAYAYWKLDDNLGSPLALDSGFNGYDGEYKNYVIQQQPAGLNCERTPHPEWACEFNANPGPVYTTSYKSAYFGGRDDHIQIEQMPQPPSTSLTLELWAKPDFSVGESRGLFRHTIVAWVDAAGRPNCAMLNYEDTPATGSTVVAGTGKWFHLVCKRTPTQILTYVNGNLEATTNVPGTSDYTSYGTPQGYIGFAEKVSDQWWKGWIDDVALYKSGLSAKEIKWHAQIGLVDDGNYDDHSSGAPNLQFDIAPPVGDTIVVPANNTQYSPDAFASKGAPVADFTCTDPQYNAAPLVIAPGPGCQATVTPVDNANSPTGPTSAPFVTGVPLPGVTPGQRYRFTVTATDAQGNTWSHNHFYYVQNTGNGFGDLISCNVGGAVTCLAPWNYWRLDDAPGATVMDDAMNNNDGEFKNDQDQSTSPGISGGTGPNNTRSFFGLGGYAYVNGIDEPPYGYTMELWVKPKDEGDMMLMQHGGTGALWIADTNGAAAGGSYVRFRPEERGPTIQSALPITGTPNQWYYVAGTYDGITARLYVVKSLPVGSQGTWNGTGFDTVSAPVHYKPSGTDTLYVGYGDQAPWLRGDEDEVAYFKTALPSAKLRQHFEADPPAGKGAPSKANSANSSTKAAKARKLRTARAKMRTIAKKLAVAKHKVRSLQRHHAGKKTIRKAKARVKTLTKQLKAARKSVKKLS